jgi:hypothetical protein
VANVATMISPACGRRAPLGGLHLWGFVLGALLLFCGYDLLSLRARRLQFKAGADGCLRAIRETGAAE